MDAHDNLATARKDAIIINKETRRRAPRRGRVPLGPYSSQDVVPIPGKGTSPVLREYERNHGQPRQCVTGRKIICLSGCQYVGRFSITACAEAIRVDYFDLAFIGVCI